MKLGIRSVFIFFIFLLLNSFTTYFGLNENYILIEETVYLKAKANNREFFPYNLVYIIPYFNENKKQLSKDLVQSENINLKVATAFTIIKDQNYKEFDMLDRKFDKDSFDSLVLGFRYFSEMKYETSKAFLQTFHNEKFGFLALLMLADIDREERVRRKQKLTLGSYQKAFDFALTETEKDILNHRIKYIKYNTD